MELTDDQINTLIYQFGKHLDDLLKLRDDSKGAEKWSYHHLAEQTVEIQNTIFKQEVPRD